MVSSHIASCAVVKKTDDIITGHLVARQQFEQIVNSEQKEPKPLFFHTLKRIRVSIAVMVIR
jgi:hypothetical protein